MVPQGPFIAIVQLLNHVWLFVTPWIPACQPPLSSSTSQSLPKFMSTEWVMPSNHLVLCHPLLLCSQSFLASGSFAVSQLFASGGQSIGASVSVLPMNIQGWFPLGLTGLISMLSKGLSRVFSSTSAVISTNITTSLPVVYSLSRNHFLYSLMKSNSSSTSFNNNLKVWNTVRITKMWHRDTKWVNAVGNIVLVDVAWWRVATKHEFVKNPKIKQVKHNKTRHAYA